MRALTTDERDELLAALDLALNAWDESVLEPLFDELTQHRYSTELIIAHWHRKYGDCNDCGLPAAYRLHCFPADADHNRFCSVCAADHAAGGDDIYRIEDS